MKSYKKNNILKEASVLLIALFIVLSTMAVSGIRNFQGPPEKPSITGPTEGEVDVEYIFCTSTTDPENDDIYYWIDWGDGTSEEWIGPYPSGEEVCIGHTYTSSGTFCIKVKAKDIGDVESEWSDPLCIDISGECGTFMGLEVCPLGDALLDIGEVLHVWNMDDEGDDGVWVNLEDTYNSWDCYWNNPDSDNYLPIGTSMKCELNAIVNKEPDQIISVYSETKVDDYTWEVLVSGNDVKSYSIEAFLGNKTVFRNENITIEQPSNTFLIGIIDVNQPLYFKWDLHIEGSCTDKCKNNENASIPWMIRTFKPIPPQDVGVLWTWEDQGVYDLEIDTLVIGGEFINSSDIVIISDVSIYVKDIPSLTITDMYARYNEPPEKPTINGPTNGKAGEEFNYTFITTDPEGNKVYYYIAWGDNSDLIYIGPYSSGEEVTLSHEWSEDGTYNVQAKAKDIHFLQSEFASLEVTIPRLKTFSQLFIFGFLERFPILERLLSLIRAI